ncbi:MAG: DUF5698 domain-containing protein [Actinomycetota bacterium]|nr:DUF5698 domain-containing protein [Actinomycetota bacterium]
MELLIWLPIIFIGRVIDVGLGTIRFNMIMRKRKIFAAVIGFIEVIIFVAVIARVVQDLNNIYMILAYGAGFAVGTLVGIKISEKLSRDLISTNIISKKHSQEIEDMLREEGFGATCYRGTGKEGRVRIINVICRESNLYRLSRLVSGVDPDAFIVNHTLEGFRGGYGYGLKGKK